MNLWESNFSFIPHTVYILKDIATESQLFNSMIKVSTLFGLHFDHHLILQYSQNTFLTFHLQKFYESKHTGSQFIRDWISHVNKNLQRKILFIIQVIFIISNNGV